MSAAQTDPRTRSRIQQLRADLRQCNQNGKTIAAYYEEFKKIWGELSGYISVPNCSCQCGERDEEETHQFLMGLDHDYDTARSNLLAQDPLPSLDKAYALLIKQERRETLRKRRRHLPADLLPEILSRQPVKSLLRLRCVSKTWLSVLDDADFVQLHLKNFTNNRDETQLMVARGVHQKCVLRRSDTFETNSETLCYLQIKPSFSHGWCIVCSVDGLILLRSGVRVFRTIDLQLWNPSIRKFHKLPFLPEISGSYFEEDVEIGIGYDPLGKDYKHLKLIFVDARKTLHSVAIYSLGADSWKIINCLGNSSNWHWELYGDNCRGVPFQGSLYFVAKDARKICGYDLVSFDLSNEVFSCVGMPEDPYLTSTDYNWLKHRVLIDGEGALSLFYTSYDQSFSCMWVLKRSGESTYWTKRYSFQPTLDDNILHFKKNGDILIQRFVPVVAPEDGTEGVWNGVVSYSPRTNQYKILHGKIDSKYSTTHVFRYDESLILLK